MVHEWLAQQLYGKLHGNYMLKDKEDPLRKARRKTINTNCHELSMNGWRSNYMGNYMVITC